MPPAYVEPRVTRYDLRMRRLCFLLLPLLPLLSLLPALTGCFAPTIATDWASAVAEHHDGRDSGGSVAERLLSGFDPVSDAGISERDRVLCRLTLRQDDVVKDEWLIRATVIHPKGRRQDGSRGVLVDCSSYKPDGSRRKRLVPYFLTWRRGDAPIPSAQSAAVAISVEVFDAEGVRLSTRTVWLGTKYLHYGMLSACRVESEGEALSAEKLSRWEMANRALFSFLSLVHHDEVLRAAFWKVVTIPTLWSVLTNWDVKVRVEPLFDKATVTNTDVDGHSVEAFNLPMQVLGNGQPMLLTSLQVVEPHSPRTITAGVVSMVVVKPGAPGTRITMQMLAARRGSVSRDD